MHEFHTWLDGLGITLEDAEATVREVCGLRDDGASPEEIAKFFRAAHDVQELAAHRISDLAALLVFRGRLKRLQGGRYVHARGRSRPYVMAVVRVPVEEWEQFGGRSYVLSGARAAWVAGDGDRA